MALGIKRWVAQALLVCLCYAPTLAGKTLLLIDNSGSMGPNYPELARKLGEMMHTGAGALQNEKIDIALFNIRVIPINDFSSPEFYAHDDTLLNDALTHQLGEYDRIWLLTDNVQDVGGNQDMASFYSTLRSAGIKGFYVFPYKQEGGREGLLIYAINTRDGKDAFASLAKQVEAFQRESEQKSEQKRKGVTALIMKPLGENVIDVQVTQGPKFEQFAAGDTLAFQQTVTIGPKFSHLFFEPSPAENVRIESPFVEQSCLLSEKQVAEKCVNNSRTVISSLPFCLNSGR